MVRSPPATKSTVRAPALRDKALGVFCRVPTCNSSTLRFIFFSNPNHPILHFVNGTRFPRRRIHSEVSVEKHFQEGTAEPQISPLRFAPVEMTKGRAASLRESRC